MPKRQFNKEEIALIKSLAESLREKIEYVFPREYNETAMNEIIVLRKRLEDMGFTVTWSITLDLATLKAKAEVTLWLPKELN